MRRFTLLLCTLTLLALPGACSGTSEDATSDVDPADSAANKPDSTSPQDTTDTNSSDDTSVPPSDTNEPSDEAGNKGDTSSDTSTSDGSASCEGPNPEGCMSDEDCGDGKVCDMDECGASECECSDGQWLCVDDCAAGVCVEDNTDPKPTCEAQDARGEGQCDAIIGVIWNGEKCVTESGCSCEGEDCDAIYDYENESACRQDHAHCSADCEAQDATGEGQCDMVIGYKWNGTECTSVGGCSCNGDDCDNLYMPKEDCKEAYKQCSTSEVCGGKTGEPNTCESGQYCDYPENSCGAADQTGRCRVQPDGCATRYDPVCGCDGNTYGNSCEAAAAGVDVRHEGECN